MDALARPARSRPLATGLAPPAPLTPELAAVAWPSPTPMRRSGSMPAWRRARPSRRVPPSLHTGARITDDTGRGRLRAGLRCRRLPEIRRLRAGHAGLSRPHRHPGALAVSDLSDREGWHLDGPGIRDSARLAASPLPADMPRALPPQPCRLPAGDRPDPGGPRPRRRAAALHPRPGGLTHVRGREGRRGRHRQRAPAARRDPPGRHERPRTLVAQIREQMALLVDRVMTEGSLHDPDLAALALKQARGDLIEAVFFGAGLPHHPAPLRRLRAGRDRRQ